MSITYNNYDWCSFKKRDLEKKFGDLQNGKRGTHGDHLPHHKCIRNTSTCGTTPTEHLLNAGRRPQTYQKARNSLCTWGQKKKRKKKKQRQKNRDGTSTSGRGLWRRKSFHTLGSPFSGEDGGLGVREASEPWRRAQQWGGEGKAERFPHGGSVPTSTQQPKRLVCSPTRAGGGWELRLRLRSDPRERAGVGCVNTAWRG